MPLVSLGTPLMAKAVVNMSITKGPTWLAFAKKKMGVKQTAVVVAPVKTSTQDANAEGEGACMSSQEAERAAKNVEAALEAQADARRAAIRIEEELQCLASQQETALAVAAAAVQEAEDPIQRRKRKEAQDALKAKQSAARNLAEERAQAAQQNHDVLAARAARLSAAALAAAPRRALVKLSLGDHERLSRSLRLCREARSTPVGAHEQAALAAALEGLEERRTQQMRQVAAKLVGELEARSALCRRDGRLTVVGLTAHAYRAAAAQSALVCPFYPCVSACAFLTFSYAEAGPTALIVLTPRPSHTGDACAIRLRDLDVSQATPAGARRDCARGGPAGVAGHGGGQDARDGRARVQGAPTCDRHARVPMQRPPTRSHQNTSRALGLSVASPTVPRPNAAARLPPPASRALSGVRCHPRAGGAPHHRCGGGEAGGGRAFLLHLGVAGPAGDPPPATMNPPPVLRFHSI